MRRSGSYGQRVKQIGFDHYRLFWTLDRKVRGSRLRFPTEYWRDTDEKGAVTFRRKWNLPLTTGEQPK